MEPLQCLTPAQVPPSYASAARAWGTEEKDLCLFYDAASQIITFRVKESRPQLLERMMSRPLEFQLKIAEMMVDIVKMSACIMSKIVVEVMSGSPAVREWTKESFEKWADELGRLESVLKRHERSFPGILLVGGLERRRVHDFVGPDRKTAV